MSFASAVNSFYNSELTQGQTCALLEQLGLPVVDSEYAMVMFKFEGSDDIQMMSAAQSADIINQTWASLCCDDMFLVSGSFTGNVYGILKLSHTQTVSRERIRAVLEELLHRIDFHISTHGQCLLSPFMSSFTAVPSLINHLQELEDYLILLEKPAGLYPYDDLAIPHPWGKPETFGLESRYTSLLTALSVNDFREAQHVLNEMMDVDFFNVTWTIQMTHVMKYSLLNLIRISMEHMKMVVGTEFFDQHPYNLWGIVYKKRISEIRSETNLIFDSYYAYANQIKNGTGPVWNSTIKEYIREDLGNPELTVATISARIGLNAAYVGRVFKKYNGMQLMDYIHQLRIEEAIRLLDDGLRLNVVSTMVGYDSTRRFCQVFKRITGKTPSTFQRQRLCEKSIPTEGGLQVADISEERSAFPEKQNKDYGK